MRPAVLLREERHAEGERVHAREHPPARAEHAGDLRDEILGAKPHRQGPVLGYHRVRAAVGDEPKVRAVGDHRGHGALVLVLR
jgi:hypothetical protein